jgi:hypothetical protein
MKAGLSILCVLSVCLNPAIAGAEAFTFIGEVGYRIEGGQATLWAERIQNVSGWDSGLLRLKLMATPSEYEGGSLSGYTLGSYRLGYLDADQYYQDVEVDTDYTPPPEGQYFLTLILTESDGGDEDIVDYRNFEESQWLGDEDSWETIDAEDDDTSCFITCF